MVEPAVPISHLFRVPDRYLRSIQLERDFLDPSALDRYVVTPSMAEAFGRIAGGLAPASGRRAWRITGDYGVGKSAFALALAHLLGGGRDPSVAKVADKLGWSSMFAVEPPRLVPILLTGSRTSLVGSIAAGIGEAVGRGKRDGRKARYYQQVEELVAAARTSCSTAVLEQLFEIVRNQLSKEGYGLLLIVDELGKHLELAAHKPEGEDVFVLQRLAEIAARSAERPLVFVGLLHQGFQAYADRLPVASRHEWDKVAGRFDEIVFDQPLTHTAALVAGALNVDLSGLSEDVSKAADAVWRSAGAGGWLGRGEATSGRPVGGSLYPLHPTVLPVLVKFFARFGQNERSLFGFLLSSDPFGLQDFSAQSIEAERWYGLAEFYDYVRALFGHRLAGGSYRSQWLRIAATVDGAVDVDPTEIVVLKTVAVLNLLDAEDLSPTDEALMAALSPRADAMVNSAVAWLKTRGLLFQRGRGGSYRLWPGSSVNLEEALANAKRALGPLGNVAAALGEYLDQEPILARRHYVETGTMRYFDLSHVHVSAMEDALRHPTEADGLVIVALADSETERAAAAAAATEDPFDVRPDVLVCVGAPLSSLAPELQELRNWKWVMDNTPELSEDAFAAAEVFRQLSSSRRELVDRISATLGLAGRSDDEVAWFRNGVRVDRPSRGGLTALLSGICNELFFAAPLVNNELLNRNSLSSAAAAARMRLVEGMYTGSDRPVLGMETTKSPPEKSMYMSVLQKGKLHVETAAGWAVVEPGEDDPLRLKPSFERMAAMIADARGERVQATELLDCLRRRPYGVRSGVAPLLLAVFLRTRAHEIAIYERGTFLHRFGPSDFLRLTKAPATFEIQHCRVVGVRLDVFLKLAEVFAPSRDGRNPDLLDVVRPLCQFAAQLPEYTRKGAPLGRQAMAVRDVLLSAREPSTMLFKDLPAACGLEASYVEGEPEKFSVDLFVDRLSQAVADLRAAYPELLDRIVGTVAEAAGEDRAGFDRARLAARASRVSLAANEPRLRTFALRLRDPGLSDGGWAEALASFILARPPSKWATGDEARFGAEVGALAELFGRVEAAAFGNSDAKPNQAAIRLNLTRGDGQDLVRVIEPRSGTDLSAEARAVRSRLPSDRSLRLQLLVDLIWSEMSAAKSSSGDDDAGDARTNRSVG